MSGSAIAEVLTSRPDIFAFEVRGRIHAADIEAMARTLESAFDRLGTVDILIVMRHWDGLDMGAAFDGEALKAQARRRPRCCLTRLLSFTPHSATTGSADLRR